MELAVFLLFAALALVSAVVVVIHRNPVYSTMSLVVTLLSLAGLFVLLGAPFIAALQVLIYTGAILVLFLFVIMLLNIGREETGPSTLLSKVPALLAAAIFGVMVVLFTWRAFAGAAAPPLTEEYVSFTRLARELFDRYLLTFELVGLLLLVAVIAATVVARRVEPGPDGSAGAGGRSSAARNPLSQGEAPAGPSTLVAGHESPRSRSTSPERGSGGPSSAARSPLSGGGAPAGPRSCGEGGLVQPPRERTEVTK